MKTTAEMIAEYKRRIEVMESPDFTVIERRNLTSRSSLWDSYTNDPQTSDWDWYVFDYRAKPKLIEGWVNVYTDGPGGLHESRKDAEEFAGSKRIRCAKVREVPDDD